MEYLRSVCEKQSGGHLDYLDIPSGYSGAIRKLALHYESIKDCENAIYWFQRYENHSMCGIGATAAQVWKIHHVAVCKIETGKVKEGLAMLEKLIYRNGFEPNRGAEFYLIDFYNQRGQLDEVEKKFKELGIAQSSYPTGVQEYIALIRMSDKKDAEGLWNVILSSSQNGLLREKAMNYFIALGLPASELALTKLNVDHEFRLASIALGRMKFKAAIRPIISILRFQKNIWVMQDLLYSLALMNDPVASEIVKKYADEGSRPAIDALKKLYGSMILRNSKTRKTKNAGKANLPHRLHSYLLWQRPTLPNSRTS